jgi:hypothetical protein
MARLARLAFMLAGTLGWFGGCAFPQSAMQQQVRQEQAVQTIMGQVRGMILQSGPGW